MKKNIDILIIDDDAIIRRSIARMLGRNDVFTVHEAVNAEEIFNLLKSCEIQCILMDYYMSDMTGIELMRKLRESGISVPVVMLTGQGDEQLAASIIKAGAYEYIPKKSLSDPDIASILTVSILNAISHHAENTERVRSQVALELSEARYRGLIDNSPILMLRFSPEDHMISFVNDSFCRYFKVERFAVLGENLMNILPRENHDTFTRNIAGISGQKPVATFEIMTPAYREQNRKWQIWTVQSICADDGSVMEYQCMGEDITSLKLAQEEVVRQKRYLQSIIDSQENMILVADRERIYEVNISFLQFFGFRSPEDMKANFDRIIGMTVETGGYLTPEDTRFRWLRDEEVIEGQYSLVAFRPEGASQVKVFSLKYSRLSIDSDIFVLEFSDVTEIEERSREFENRASYDPLTRIFNRRKFNEFLDREMKESIRTRQDMSLVYFDIDHFKRINDTFGHQAGDDVLRELASLVSGLIRKADIFARWGGEEFLLLLTDTSITDALHLGEKLRVEVMNHNFPAVGNLTCSFGVTGFAHGENAETFINRADRGLYHAKEGGRNRVVGIRPAVRQS